jgi:ankyrin repeat protein
VQDEQLKVTQVRPSCPVLSTPTLNQNPVLFYLHVLGTAFTDSSCRPLLPQLLIHHGADVDAADKDGRTAVMLAIIKNRVSIAAALLQANASVAASDMHGINALMCVPPPLNHNNSRVGLHPPPPPL